MLRGRSAFLPAAGLLRLGSTFPRSVITGLTHHLELDPRQASDEPPIILIHGAGGGAANWYRMFGPLSERRRVFAPDLPGFGLTPATPITPPLGIQAAEFLRTWLDALHIEKATVIGTSFGGLAAMRFAQHNPARVDRLVLIDTAGAGPETTKMVLAAKIPLLANTLFRPSRKGTRTLLRRLLLTKRLAQADEDALVEYLYWSAQRSGAAYMVQALRAFAGRRGQTETLGDADLKEIRAKTLVVWGALDRFFPPSHADRLVTAMPHATKVIIEGAGHSPNWEQPQRLAEELLRFLNND
jgi:pimeloyl-ACP methyl ester carboxylesterase